jgi:predicted HicB family RNase H-like nuclease
VTERVRGNLILRGRMIIDSTVKPYYSNTVCCTNEEVTRVLKRGRTRRRHGKAAKPSVASAKRKVTVYLDPEVKRALGIQAASEERSLAALLAQAAEDYLGRVKKQ